MKISVVTVARNAEATIRDAITSVREQRGVQVEHILIDGASTDATLACARSVAGENMNVISEPDRGIYDAMNKGCRAASGDLVGFLNADDFLCRTDALALVAETAKSTGAHAVAGGVAIVRPSDAMRVIRAYPATGYRSWMTRFAHMPPHPGFYVRRDTLNKIGYFDDSFKIMADFEWMVRFFCVNRLNISPLRQTLVAMRSGGISTRGLASAIAINREAYQSLRNHELAASRLLIWSKYLAKFGQLIMKPVEYPAPTDVRWMPDLTIAACHGGS